MKVGIHALVFVTDWSESSIASSTEQAAAAGYDLLEVVVFDPSEARPEETRAALERNGLSGIGGIALNPGADISSADPEIARAGETLIRDAMSAMRDMGIDALGGVTHSAMHRYPTAVDPDALRRVVDTYARLADHARTTGVRLGIEAVNRYESNLINTIDQAASIVRQIGSDALFAHADTYHMNIEELSVVDALTRNMDVIGHVHIGESNRGYLGAGSVNFAEVFATLQRQDYSGAVVFEAFSPAILDQNLSNVLACWRDHWSDSEDLARHAHDFMQAQVKSASQSMRT
ncbi:sugar phosphate isomerase/epimerase family protein [Arenibacterium sp. LLYu02]|uniref:sugar phosphate isomerase/epimerase family protein n=1 Tax=Arenibacterium sp. LLYu02 TaxID=3404132 RepID=UPI003B21FBCE